MDSRYTKLADFGKKLLEVKALSSGLPIISKYAKEVIGAERCSIFVYSEDRASLWTTLADEVDPIVVASDRGIVGHTLKVRKPVIVFDASMDPLYLSEIEEETGYKIKNIITAPVFNSEREIIGVLELLNKPRGFEDDDVKFMIFFAHYISGYIELATLYDNQSS